MSAMIKAISNVRLPFSRSTVLFVALWACVFLVFVTLGLRR